MDLNLESRIALVTGSNRGTGEIIAKHLAQEGARVIRHSNHQEGYHYLCEHYPNEPSIWGDLSNNQGAEQAIKQLWQHVAAVDILINNLGTATAGKWQDFSEENWLDIYQQNVLSAVRITHAVLPGMREKGWGRIVQLSTIGSISPNARMPHYYASKGAMSNMTVSLAKELSGTGITVNTISPGLILTDELKAGYRIKAQRKGWSENWEEIEAEIVKQDFPNLCARIARREEVADLVCFVVSDKAGFINAQNLRIDGGSIALSI